MNTPSRKRKAPSSPSGEKMTATATTSAVDTVTSASKKSKLTKEDKDAKLRAKAWAASRKAKKASTGTSKANTVSSSDVKASTTKKKEEESKVTTATPKTRGRSKKTATVEQSVSSAEAKVPQKNGTTNNTDKVASPAKTTVTAKKDDSPTKSVQKKARTTPNVTKVKQPPTSPGAKSHNTNTPQPNPYTSSTPVQYGQYPPPSGYNYSQNNIYSQQYANNEPTPTRTMYSAPPNYPISPQQMNPYPPYYTAAQPMSYQHPPPQYYNPSMNYNPPPQMTHNIPTNLPTTSNANAATSTTTTSMKHEKIHESIPPPSSAFQSVKPKIDESKPHPVSVSNYPIVPSPTVIPKEDETKEDGEMLHSERKIHSSLGAKLDKIKKSIPGYAKYFTLFVLNTIGIYIILNLVYSFQGGSSSSSTSTSKDILFVSNSKVKVPLTSKTTNTLTSTPCFFDYGFDVEPKPSSMGMDESLMDDIDITTTLPCDGDDNALPCPTYGRCQGGKLIDCLANHDDDDDDGFFTPSDDKSSCIPSLLVYESLDKIETLLTMLTVKRICGGKCPSLITKREMRNVNDGSFKYVFKLEGVARVLDLTPDFVQKVIEEVQDSSIYFTYLDDKDGQSLWLGYSNSFIEEHLSIPTTCYFRILIFDLIKMIFTVIYNIIKMTTSLVWINLVSYPLATVGSGVALYFVNWMRRRRQNIIELRKMVSNIKNMAYEKLKIECKEGEGCAALHLRDDIAHELYPQTCYARKHLLTNVWPRVVNEVRADNRVVKSRKTVHGKSLEWWEWVAVIDSKKVQ